MIYHLYEKYSEKILFILTLFVFLLFPNLLCTIFVTEGFGESITYLFTSLIYLLPVFSIFFIIKKKNIQLCILILFLIFSLLEIPVIILFKNSIAAGNILAIINTNRDEAISFISNIHALLLPLIVLLALFTLTVYLLKFYEERLSLHKRLIGLLLSLVIVSGFVFYKIHYAYQDVLTYRYFLTTRVLNRSPYNVPYQLYNVYDYYRVRRLIAASEHFSFNAFRDDSITEKEIYILAIGESLRYDNISLNGIYPRSTTPHLEQEQNLVLYHDYFSAACLTMFSVPQILTRASPQDYELNYKEKGVFLPFKELGFKTYAISWYGNLLAYEKYLTDGVDSLIIVQSDFEIVEQIQHLSARNDKVFFILQFLGNHSYYYNYPPEYDVYQPNINNYSLQDKNNDSLYINAYDNTILYHDYILSGIIKHVKDTKAVADMLYISDHGENISSTGGGHGGDSKPKKTEYHVPLMIWYSDEYLAKFPDKIKYLKSNVNAKVNAGNVFYSVLDLADISIDEALFDASKSIVNANFKEDSVRCILLPDGKNILEIK